MALRWKSDEEPASPLIDIAAYALTAAGMTTSEQMFFLGAPLAHVLHYEERLRSDRIARSANLTHARRIISHMQLPCAIARSEMILGHWSSRS